jgi:hypothetical protein
MLKIGDRGPLTADDPRSETDRQAALDFVGEPKPNGTSMQLIDGSRGGSQRGPL